MYKLFLEQRVNIKIPYTYKVNEGIPFMFSKVNLLGAGGGI